MMNERLDELERRLQALENALKKDDNEFEKIITLVAKQYNVTIERLKSKSRERKFVEPRQIIMYLARINTEHTERLIGERFNRDRTTVIHACKTVQNLMYTDETYKEIIFELVYKLNNDGKNKKSTGGRTN